jgi:hypothetical protein
MRDEDTDEEVLCCFCGAPEGECSHWLAVVDVTFNQCVAGYAYDRYHEFRDEIEEAFLTALESGERRPDRWRDPELAGLWADVVKEYSPSNLSFHLDDYCVTRLIGGLFLEGGADIYPGQISEGGGPGLSSGIWVYFAKEPNLVFEKAISLLKARLRG